MRRVFISPAVSGSIPSPKAKTTLGSSGDDQHKKINKIRLIFFIVFNKKQSILIRNHPGNEKSFKLSILSYFITFTNCCY